MLELKEWCQLAGIMTTVLVTGFGIVKFTLGRLDLKVDEKFFNDKCNEIERNFDKGEIRFGEIQKTLLEIHGMASVTQGEIKGINKRLDKINGGLIK